MTFDTELDHLANGVAILGACILQTLQESDPSFQDRFLDRLGKAYQALEDETGGEMRADKALLSSTVVLTGFSRSRG